jgi:hypothetical protein
MKNENQNNINNSNNNSEKSSIQIKNYKSFLKIYEYLNKKVLKSINKTSNLKNKSIQSQLNDDEEKLFLITNKIVDIYLNILNNFQKLFENIMTKITNYLNDYNQLQIKYSNFEEINKLYKQKNKKINELKNDYHQNGKELEKCILTNLEQNEINILEIDKLLNKTKESLNKYKMEVIETNKCIIEYNKKQIDLKENYNKIDKIVLFDIIKEEFNNNLELNLRNISDALLGLNKSKKLNENKDLEDNKFININKLKNLEKESIIHFPSCINFDDCSEEKDYLVFVKTIKYIKNAIDDKTLYNDFDEEKEKIKNETRKIILSFFNINNNFKITEEKKNKLINILKEPSIHNIFLSIMNKSRINNERSKKWINLMGECLNIILNISLKDNNYDKIKLCLILSQTFYYIDENSNIKIYISKMIEDKQFFKDYNFWKILVDTMITKQLKIYQDNNNLTDVDIIKGEGLNSSTSKKLAELLFTQILPYVNNMLNFNMDKNIIIKIVDYFKEKYIYFAQKDYETIISVISNS